MHCTVQRVSELSRDPNGRDKHRRNTPIQAHRQTVVGVDVDAVDVVVDAVDVVVDAVNDVVVVVVVVVKYVFPSSCRPGF